MDKQNGSSSLNTILLLLILFAVLAMGSLVGGDIKVSPNTIKIVMEESSGDSRVQNELNSFLLSNPNPSKPEFEEMVALVRAISIEDKVVRDGGAIEHSYIDNYFSLKKTRAHNRTLFEEQKKALLDKIQENFWLVTLSLLTFLFFSLRWLRDEVTASFQ
jgi:hypothetical protein